MKKSIKYSKANRSNLKAVGPRAYKILLLGYRL
jgi:hypothetical protein